MGMSYFELWTHFKNRPRALDSKNKESREKKINLKIQWWFKGFSLVKGNKVPKNPSKNSLTSSIIPILIQISFGRFIFIQNSLNVNYLYTLHLLPKYKSQRGEKHPFQEAIARQNKNFSRNIFGNSRVYPPFSILYWTKLPRGRGVEGGVRGKIKYPKIPFLRKTLKNSLSLFN